MESKCKKILNIGYQFKSKENREAQKRPQLEVTEVGSGSWAQNLLHIRIVLRFSRVSDMHSRRKLFCLMWVLMKNIVLIPTDRFIILICKHLVQPVHLLHPIFFLEVKRNPSSSFWSHPSLIPLPNTSYGYAVPVTSVLQGAPESLKVQLYAPENDSWDNQHTARVPGYIWKGRHVFCDGWRTSLS